MNIIKNILTALYKISIGAGASFLLVIIPFKVLYNLNINDSLFFKIYFFISLLCFAMYLLDALNQINKK